MKDNKCRSICIHGAINGSNFGDVLFARMFYSACLKRENTQVDFLQIPRFGVGEFVRKETGYTRKCGKWEYLKSDVLIMMSGGYLGLDKTDFYHVLHLYLRFIFPARLFQFIGKKVYIIGVGGGPIDSIWLRRSIIRLVNHAEKVIVRDEETKQYLVSYGARNEITVTTDTALGYDINTIPEVKNKLLFNNVDSNKLMFVHVDYPESEGDRRIAKKIIPALNQFLKKHSEYCIIMGTDNVVKKGVQYTESWKNLNTDKKHVFEYDEIDQLLAVLRVSDCIITTKLHVGILGALLNSSVLSFPVHREKTQRFYRQIGYPERSIHFNEVDEMEVLSLLETYHDKEIIIPRALVSKAKDNLNIIEEL